MDTLSSVIILVDTTAGHGYANLPLMKAKSEAFTTRQEGSMKSGVYWRGQRRWHRHDARTERLVLSALAHSKRPRQRKQRVSPWPTLSRRRRSPQHRRTLLTSGGSQKSVYVDTRTIGCIRTRRQPLGFGYIINLSSMEQEDVSTGMQTKVLIVRPRSAGRVSQKKQKFLEWHPMSSLLPYDLFSSPASCTRSKASGSRTSGSCASSMESMSVDSVKPCCTPLALDWRQCASPVQEQTCSVTASDSSSERPPALASTSSCSSPSNASQRLV